MKWVWLGVALALVAGSVLVGFGIGLRRVFISVYADNPRGCDIGLAIQQMRVFAWGAPIDGGAKLQCGEQAQIDDYLRISCHCLERPEHSRP